MNSREQAHAEDHKALRSLERRPWLIIAVAIVAIIAVSGIVYGIVNAHQTDQVRQLTVKNTQLTAQAQKAADDARAQALAGCQLYKLAAEAPVAVNPSPLGLQIAVGARAGYIIAKCDLGPLTPADPRVAALLPPNER